MMEFSYLIIPCLMIGGAVSAAMGVWSKRQDQRYQHLLNVGLSPKKAKRRFAFYAGQKRGQTLLKEPSNDHYHQEKQNIPDRFWSALSISYRYHRLLTLFVKGAAFMLFWMCFHIVFRVGFGIEMSLNYQILLISLSIAGAILGPEIWMRAHLKRRIAEIEEACPDVIDLLTLSVEVGLSFDQAIVEVATLSQKRAPRLSRELQILSRELLILPDREAAFDNLVERTGASSFKMLKLTLMQGEVYGTPVAQSLRQVANETRARLLAEREEVARKLPVFLSLPLMLLILPPVIVLSTGPGFISLMTVIRGG